MRVWNCLDKPLTRTPPHLSDHCIMRTCVCQTASQTLSYYLPFAHEPPSIHARHHARIEELTLRRRKNVRNNNPHKEYRFGRCQFCNKGTSSHPSERIETLSTLTVGLKSLSKDSTIGVTLEHRVAGLPQNLSSWISHIRSV